MVKKRETGNRKTFVLNDYYKIVFAEVMTDSDENIGGESHKLVWSLT